MVGIERGAIKEGQGKKIPDETLVAIGGLFKRPPGSKDIVSVKFAGSNVPGQEAKTIKLSRGKGLEGKNEVMPTWQQIERLSGKNGQWPEEMKWLWKKEGKRGGVIVGFDDNVKLIFSKAAQEAISGKPVA